MRTTERYPTKDNWGELLSDPTKYSGDPGTIFVGTIIDIFQRVEECKKQGSADELAELKRCWGALLSGPACAGGNLHVLDLSPECLLEAAFEKDHGGADEAIDLWREVANRWDLLPWRSMRRLILKPLDTRWWSEDVYGQMEAYFAEEGSTRG